MSKYTTGEIAKLCDVTVRTVQYYDSRGILVPSELSEGGRRLYSEADLNKMKIICFLRELDLPIDSIKKLLEEEHPENVISTLLEEQEKTLRDEIAEKQGQVVKITDIKKTLRQLSQFSVESIGDVAYIMQNRKQLKKMRITVLSVGLPIEVLELSTVIWWVKTGMWQPYVIALGISLITGVWISKYYFGKVSYICPECHSVFEPRLKDALFANHTPCTRKLTCTHCGHHGFCVETYRKEAETC